MPGIILIQQYDSMVPTTSSEETIPGVIPRGLGELAAVGVLVSGSVAHPVSTRREATASVRFMRPLG